MTQLFDFARMRERLAGVIGCNHGTTRGLIRGLLAQMAYVSGRLEDHTHPKFDQVDRLVFVCLGNINRSAFAEQVALDLGAKAQSIGLSTTTGAPAFQQAVVTATQFGLDLSHHTATDITDYEFRATDLLLTMEIRHARHLASMGIPMASIVLLGHWASPHRIHLHDPHTLSDAYFRTCFTLIRSAVQGLIAEMRVANSPCLQR